MFVNSKHRDLTIFLMNFIINISEYKIYLKKKLSLDK